MKDPIFEKEFMRLINDNEPESEFQICQVCQELTCECETPTYESQEPVAIVDDKYTKDLFKALGNVVGMDDETSTVEYTVQETFCDDCKSWSPTSKWKQGECPECVKKEAV